jgi:hypothetical protein
VISPFAKHNFVDHTVTDQTSILRFIEDNWLTGQRIGGGSFDALAGPLTSMLNLNDRDNGDNGKLILDPTTGTRAEEQPPRPFQSPGYTAILATRRSVVRVSRRDHRGGRIDSPAAEVRTAKRTAELR